MTKVHPNSVPTSTTKAATSTVGCSSNSSLQEYATTLTVWRKSLLFNCAGFTVFDAQGNLNFRVDNYMTANKSEIVLMDAAGKPLFSIRRKQRLSLGENWLIYEGETTKNHRYCVRKHTKILNGKCLAYVEESKSSKKKKVLYEIEGSYAQRSCTMYDQKKSRVAEIKRKEAAVGGVAMGSDVFSLIVESQFDTTLAMALVILLDQMFGSSYSRRFA